MTTINLSSGAQESVNENVAQVASDLLAGHHSNDVTIQFTLANGNPVYINPEQVASVR